MISAPPHIGLQVIVDRAENTELSLQASYAYLNSPQNWNRSAFDLVVSDLASDFANDFASMFFVLQLLPALEGDARAATRRHLIESFDEGKKILDAMREILEEGTAV